MPKTAIGPMKWEKQGLIYCPDGSNPWAKQYASLPIPFLIAPKRLRIFVSFCDESMIGRVGYVDVDPNNPKHILDIASHPVLDIGKPGRFDENGLIASSILSSNGKIYMYYVGYQLGQKVRYYQFGGLAISDDGGNSFYRAQETPIIDRIDGEALNRTAPFVIYENGRFRMWYVGGNEWTEVNGKSLPVYNMRYLESLDGVNWTGKGKVCLDFKNKDEHVVGRPWVYKENDTYKMFLSSRTHSKGYRLGYAESKDGLSWQRLDDKIDIDVSETGWDSQIMAYASIFKWENKTYMFYNGNDCGRTGFGYALLSPNMLAG